MSKTPLFILIGIIAIVAVVWFVTGDEAETEPIAQTSDPVPTETLTPINPDVAADEAITGDVQLESAADDNADQSVVQELPNPEPTELMAGTYEKYSADKVANADGKVVLFFKADWCPSCRVLDADIQKNLGEIPNDVTILKVDYDTATDLKKKYGVTTQHTLVHVDTAGTQLKKWSGSPRLSSVITEL